MERRSLNINTFQTRGVDRLGIPTTAMEAQMSPGLAQLRAKLSMKAKQEPNFKFYTLYSHLLRMDVLNTAWEQVLRNGGAAGYDGVTLEQVESSAEGVLGFLNGIRESLMNKTYRADPIRRVYIPKSDGKLRPLGIPTVKDRVVQAALRLVIEPIFEADFLDCSYGFRPEKSAHQAIDAMVAAAQAGQREIYDADMEKYFDSIPHDKLLKAIQMRVVDQRVMTLIKMWIEAPIYEEGKPMKCNDQGTAQGGVISPLLSNIYLHWFDKVFHTRQGPGTWAKATIIRYADDFVIMAKYITPKVQAWIQKELEGRFGLKINKEKTRIVKLEEEGSGINFLGFTMRWIGRPQIRPMEKSLKRARARIRELSDPKHGCMPIKDVIDSVNKFLKGWGAYFNKGTPSKAFQKINWYAEQRLVHFLQRRSQRGYKRVERQNWHATLKKLGLFTLTRKAFVRKSV